MLTKEQKIVFARAVSERKNILLGPFGKEVTKRKKAEAWTEVLEILLAHGADVSNVRILRDTYWHNLRRQVMGRWNNYHSGNEKIQLNEVDELVLDALNVADETPHPAMVLSPQVVLETEPDISLTYLNEDSLDDEAGEARSEDTEASEAPQIRVDRLPGSIKQDTVELNGEIRKAKSISSADPVELPGCSSVNMKLLKNKKLKLEVDLLQLQVHEKKSKLKLEKHVLKLQAEELKARTEYYTAAAEVLRKQLNPSPIATNQQVPRDTQKHLIGHLSDRLTNGPHPDQTSGSHVKNEDISDS